VARAVEGEGVVLAAGELRDLLQARDAERVVLLGDELVVDVEESGLVRGVLYDELVRTVE
jgi:hypothetical protein